MRLTTTVQWSTRLAAAVSGQWSVVSGQWSAGVVSGQWSAVSGQWSAVSGQWSTVGGRSVVGGPGTNGDVASSAAGLSGVQPSFAR